MRCLRILSLAGLVAVAGCVPRAEPPPPQPQPQPRPAPQAVAPPPAAVEWSLLPLTPGGWVYSNQGASAQALFGPANSEAHFVVRCDRASRQVVLSRPGEGNALTIRTSFGARAFPATAQRTPLAMVSASLPADDRFLDSMAFSRGRFTVEMAGAPMLVIPAWPEPARVIEDCRG
jgi:hypothetical protein